MPFMSSTSYSFGFGNYTPSNPNVPTGIGLSSNNPGINAQQIYNDGSRSNSWYWIRTSGMTQSRQVWCNMTDAGGGWMLISYNGNKQNANASLAGQWYPVAWLNGQGTLSDQFATNAMDLWYTNNASQCSQLLRLATNTANSIPTIDSSYIAHMVTYTTSTNNLSLTIPSGVNGTASFSSSNVVMGAVWSSIKGYTNLSTHTTKADSDWIYNTGAGFYWNPILPINGASRSGSGTDIGGWMRTVSKDSWGLLNVPFGSTSSGSSFPGSTLAIFIR